MDELHPLRSLVAALDAGSLSGAARRLGISQPAVSQKILALESAIGQPLLLRSRKGVRPTPAGNIAYEHASRMLSELAEMHAALDALKGDVSGRLRVTAGMLISQTVMGPVLAALRKRHPGLRVELVATDDVIDIEAHDVDFAIRFGSPGRGGGKVRKAGELEGVLVATPAYLDLVGRPRGPEDLARLGYIQYRDDPEEHEIALVHQGRQLAAPVSPSFSAHHPSLVLHAVSTDLGFAKAPRFYISEQLRDGRLVEVLPGYAPAPKPFYIVQLEHVANTPRARAFQEVLLDALQGLDGLRLISDGGTVAAATLPVAV